MTPKLTLQNQAAAKPASSPQSPLQQPAVIALRKRCEADGVGLSHYILLDRKTAK
ncbi:MAG: modified peptide precursor CbpA [Polaromonas sp.]